MDSPAEEPKPAAPQVKKAAQPAQPKKEKGANTNTSHRGRGKGDMIEVEPTSGCRDFYPQEMRIQNFLFDHWKAVAKSFGFQVSLLTDHLFFSFIIGI